VLLVVLDRTHEPRVPMRPRLCARVVVTDLGLRRLGDWLEKPIEQRGVLSAHLFSPPFCFVLDVPTLKKSIVSFFYAIS